MFDRAIIETDKFLDLPDSSKALYFLLGMEADDEGFVSPKRVMRLYQIAQDNLRILITKNFVIPFETGVVVITDWNKNNYLDKNRIKPTEYVAEKEQLLLTQDNMYVLNSGSTSIEEYRGEESRIVESTFTFESFWSVYPKKVGKKEARKKWDKLTQKQQLEVMSKLPTQVERDYSRRQKIHIPHPTTYLNGERWNDEIIKPKTQGKGAVWLG